MEEDMWNVKENNSNNFCNTWSENSQILSLQQNADENITISTNKNGKDNDSTSDDNKLSQPAALENILSSGDKDNKYINYISYVSEDTTHEDLQETCQNCKHYNEHKHLGCTNNATYGIDSSSSESEICPSTAAAEVELELELLSLVAEFSQARHNEEKHCDKCCHCACSRNTGFGHACGERATTSQSSGCGKHVQEGITSFRRSLVQKQATKNNDLWGRRTGLCSAGIISKTSTMCPDSRHPRIPGVKVDVEQKQCHFFAGGNVNGSSHVTDRSVTQIASFRPLKNRSCEQMYREPNHNYIPAKYLERQNVATYWEDRGIPLCPTTENYWETAAREPVTSLFQLASNEEDECCEQSCNNTCGCNNVACSHFVHLLNKPSFCQVHQGGKYASRIQTDTKIVASGSNENADVCRSEIPSPLCRLWKEPKRKISQKLASLNRLTNKSMASTENGTDRRLMNKCNAGDNKRSDTTYKSQPYRFMAKRKSSQRPGSIHLSLTQQKGNSDVQSHLLDVSKYKRKHGREEIESQTCLSFSKTFPTGNFNEIVHKSNESLAVMPKDGQANNDSKRPTSFKRPKRSGGPRLVAFTKEVSLCQIKSSDSRDRLIAHPLSMHENSTDNKNIAMELTYPLWYSRMQSFMQRIRNPLQSTNGRKKRNSYHRLKHSRACRRRRGINGAACCNRCLLDIPAETHASLRDNTTEERKFKKRSQVRKGNRSKHSKQRSRKTCFRRNCSRTKNTYRRTNGRMSNYTAKGRSRCVSNGWKRRSCKSSYNVHRRHDCNPRCPSLRRVVLRSKHSREVGRRRRSKTTGIQNSRRRTKQTT